MTEPEKSPLNQAQIVRFELWLDVLKTVRYLGKWAALAFISAAIAFTAVFVSQSIESLAGKTTMLKAVFEYTTGNKAAVILPWLVTIVMLVWALRERALRRRKTAQMQNHAREIETRLDPDRTGSGLLPDDRTNPKDN